MFSESTIVIETLFVVGAIGAIFSFFIVIYKFVKRIDTAIGVDSEGRSLSERMEKVEYQLWPNGGKSLADRVTKIEKTGFDNAVQVDMIRELVTIIVDSHLSTNKTKRKPKPTV